MVGCFSRFWKNLFAAINFFLGVGVLNLGLVLGLATWGCGLCLALLVLGLGLATSSPCLDCRLVAGHLFLGVAKFKLWFVFGLATWGCGWGLALLVLGLGLATSGSSCLGCRLVGGWALLVGVGTLGYRTVWPGLGTAFGVGTALS